KTDYFVKWKGYGLKSNSWVREEDMDADKLIEEFLAKHVDMVIINPIRIIDAKPDEEVMDYFYWQYLISAKSGLPQWY
ncbi:hypothetical protein ARMGADRAFT_944080, partial [Armillaria gallica]